MLNENAQPAQPAAQPAGAKAEIKYGVYAQPGNWAGKTVGDVRNQFSKLWNIPADAAAYVGKDRLEDNQVIQPGQAVEFHRRAGEKG